MRAVNDGRATEAAVVGSEGLIGVILATGGASSPLRVVVQFGGRAYRTERELITDDFAHAGAPQHLVLAFAHALMLQIAQTATCNCRHAVEQQLGRWLLHLFDRIALDELHLTQEGLTHLLGVRREGITEAAGRLQAAGLIRFGCGRAQLADRPRLEARACECYRVVKDR